MSDRLLAFLHRIQDDGLVPGIFSKPSSLRDYQVRVRVQKLVYLANAMNITLPYLYRMNIHGPYSTELAGHYVDILHNPEDDHSSKQNFSHYFKEQYYEEFKQFIFPDRHLRDDSWLEIAASILFESSRNPVEIIDRIHSIKRNYSHTKIAEIHDEIYDRLILNPTVMPEDEILREVARIEKEEQPKTKSM